MADVRLKTALRPLLFPKKKKAKQNITDLGPYFGVREIETLKGKPESFVRVKF